MPVAIPPDRDITWPRQELSRLTVGDLLAFARMAITYVGVNRVLVELVALGLDTILWRDLSPRPSL